MNTEKLFNQINKLALKEIELYGGPLLVHYQISLDMCERFAKLYGVDENLCKAGIALADIKLGYCMKNGLWSKHIDYGYKYAEEILESLKVDEQTKKLLLHCVLTHHGDITYENIIAEIVANADCYRFLTPAGIIAYFQFATSKTSNQNDAIDMAIAKMTEKKNVVSLTESKEELFPFYDNVKKFLLDAKV